MNGTLSAKTLMTELTPQSPNLFEVRLFQSTTDNYSFKNTELYCSDFELPPLGLAFERHPFLKEHFIDGSKTSLTNKVMISWAEDEKLSVWKYHQQWLACFYDRVNDQYVTGTEGKKRYAEIAYQKQVFSNKLSYTDLYTIRLIGLTPQVNFALKGAWGDVSWPHYTMTYNVDRVEILPNKDTIQRNEPEMYTL